MASHYRGDLLHVSRFVMAPFLITWVLFSAGLSIPAMAQIATDGTVGSALSLSGPDFTISNTLGTQTGANLFHSFQTFHIQTGESATFTGPSGIDNVISRVTGGQGSFIDGLLRSTIPDADLWFLNPAGVMFGENATVGLPGSLHVGTGDEVRFGDGATFNATTPAISTLTIASPEAFGFLGSSPGAITVDGSSMEIAPGETLSLVGGDIDISGGAGATIRAEGGKINLIAVSSANEVNVADASTGSVADGNIHLSESANIRTRGPGGGLITLRAGTFVARDSRLVSANTGSQDADGGITVIVDLDNGLITAEADSPARGGNVLVETSTLVTNNSSIRSASFASGQTGSLLIVAEEIYLRTSFVATYALAAGDAGTFTIEAGRLVLFGNNSTRGSRIGSLVLSSSATGNAGSVNITADEIEIRDGADIQGSTAGRGNAGSITIIADRLLIVNGNSLLRSGVESLAALGSDGGNAGSIVIEAGEIEIRNRSAIDTSTFSFGNAGQISIVADRIAMTGPQSGIQSSVAPSGFGNAGSVEIHATEVELIEGASIQSSTFGDGNAGSVAITADRLFIDGRNNEQIGGVGSQNFSFLGEGGSVVIEVGELEILERGTISSGTFFDGDAGNVIVDADSVILDGPLTFINSNTRGRGDGGTVAVNATDIVLRNGGSIGSSSTFGEGNAGNVSIDADSVTLTGRFSSIASGGNAGDAGNVTITARQIELFDRARISTETEGAGNAGNITISADRVLVNGAPNGIESNSFFGTGNAGNVMVTANEVELLNGGAIESTALSGGNAGSITVEANSLVIAGASEDRLTSKISSRTFSSGDAGSITILAGNIDIRDNGAIIAVTNGTGNAGDISIEADQLVISGELTGVTSDSAPGAAGDAGSVTVSAGSVDISDGGFISSAVLNFSQAASGSVTVTAGDLRLSGGSSISTTNDGSGLGGDISIAVSNLLQSSASSITTEAAAGDGGRILVSGGAVDLLNSEISTTVLGSAGNGGDIQWNTNTLVLDNSIMRANAVFGNGGNMTIDLQQLITHPGRTATIEASSELGISGDINISTPETEGVGGVVVLSGDFLDTTALLDEPCAARVGVAETSSLVPAGRGGLPVSPDEPGSALYFTDQAPGTSSSARVAPELQLPMRQYANVLWGCSTR